MFLISLVVVFCSAPGSVNEGTPLRGSLPGSGFYRMIKRTISSVAPFSLLAFLDLFMEESTAGVSKHTGGIIPEVTVSIVSSFRIRVFSSSLVRPHISIIAMIGTLISMYSLMLL